MGAQAADLSTLKDGELVRTRQLGRGGSGLVFGLGLLCSLFHLTVLLVWPIDPWFFRSAHLLLTGTICFLTIPARVRGPHDRCQPFDYACVALLAVPTAYMWIVFDE
jgi:TRAP-type uncharacterized transport system fused permease subunit